MGHQDRHLELRAMFAEEPLDAPLDSLRSLEASGEPIGQTAIDHDDAHSWRETARFFRKAA